MMKKSPQNKDFHTLQAIESLAMCKNYTFEWFFVEMQKTANSVYKNCSFNIYVTIHLLKINIIYMCAFLRKICYPKSRTPQNSFMML